MENTYKPLQLYRNETILVDKDAALSSINSYIENNDVYDGEIIAVRYNEEEGNDTIVKTLLGVISIDSNNNAHITLFEESIGLKAEMIKNEKVTEKAFEKVKDSVGLTENFKLDLSSDALLKDCTSVSDALKTLSSLINDIQGKYVEYQKLD